MQFPRERVHGCKARVLQAYAPASRVRGERIAAAMKSAGRSRYRASKDTDLSDIRVEARWYREVQLRPCMIGAELFCACGTSASEELDTIK